jgi:hypothetical protein
MNRRIIHLCLLWAGLFHSVAQAAPPAAAPPPPAPSVPAGTVFHFVGMIYLAGRIEFRDAGGDLFPNYWYEAKFGDVRGRMVFDPQKPEMKMILNCGSHCQGASGSDLKILGEVFSDDKIPPARFTVLSMGAWKPAAAESKSGPCELAPIEGELAVADRTIPVKTDARITYHLPKGRSDMGGLHAANLLGMSMDLKIEFTIKGRDLGLKKVADKDIAVVVRSRAFTEETILNGTKKKTLAEARVLPLPEDGKTTP